MDSTPRPEGYPEKPVAATVIQPMPIQIQERRPSLLGRLFFAFIVLVLLGSLFLNFILFLAVGMLGFSSTDSEGRVQEKFFSHQKLAPDKVAIISIEGVIMTGEGFIKQQIDHALQDAKDGSLKAVVLRVNSPGGTITGSDYIFHQLRDFAQKTNVPIVVSMGPIAASGGYYVSMAVGDKPGTIFAERTTWTGSIGVIIPHYNLAGLMKELGVQEDSVASGYLKQMGSLVRPMTDEERNIFKELVDSGFTQFKDVIKQGRQKFQQDPQALDKLATGQIFTAQQAQENGLIDKIGYIEDAVDQAIELAHLDKNNVKVIKYKPEPSLANMLLGAESKKSNFDLSALLDLSAPRAYYLCTWLPPLGTEK